MPQLSFSPPPGKRSESPPSSPSQRRTFGIFTVESPSSPSDRDLFQKATEPFPERLFRMPVPDEVFAAIGEAGEMSDSALRALLALIRLSFRFEPEKSKWINPGRSFTRGEIQAECGLSGQGTRNGLSELETAGHVSVSRSGRSYEYALEMGVPRSNYTYLPTSLLEEASGLSGTELRVLLVVFRATWGWTYSGDSEENSPEHKRWAQLSTRDLAQQAGRSKSAVKTAAKGLSGSLLSRRRPQGEAYYYRVLEKGLLGPQASGEGSYQEEQAAVEVKKKRFFSVGIPNDLAPDRQRSGPPSFNRESFSREAKHRAHPRGSAKPSGNGCPRDGNSAVRGTQSSNSRRQDRRKEPNSKRSSHQGSGREAPSSDESIDLTGFSERKRALGQKLANVGVWPRRIPELLGRYSTERVEANFQLYRKRAQNIENGGAWLAAAIEGGFALPSRPETSSEPESGAPDLPEPGTKVTETRTREIIRAGKATEDDFDRFADYDDPDKKQHIYQAEKRPSPATRG